VTSGSSAVLSRLASRVPGGYPLARTGVQPSVPPVRQHVDATHW